MGRSSTLVSLIALVSRAAISSSETTNSSEGFSSSINNSFWFSVFNIFQSFLHAYFWTTLCQEESINKNTDVNQIKINEWFKLNLLLLTNELKVINSWLVVFIIRNFNWMANKQSIWHSSKHKTTSFETKEGRRHFVSYPCVDIIPW